MAGNGAFDIENDATLLFVAGEVEVAELVVCNACNDGFVGCVGVHLGNEGGVEFVLYF